MTKNRLRSLRNDSLSQYTNLAYLYMRDNFIHSIEEASFDKLEYLEVLDLSYNGLSHLPKSLLTLPRLRKLYIEDNLFKTFDYVVTSPLAFLHLAKNADLATFPRLDVQPDLTYLNISYTRITDITIDDIAPFCSLQSLDAFKDPPLMAPAYNCDCSVLLKWLQLHRVKARLPFNTSTCQQCPNVTFSNETMLAHGKCSRIIETRQEAQKARTMWITVFCVLGASVVGVFVALCLVHKRNKSKRGNKLKEEQRITATNANTELLNSNLQEST